MGRVAGQLGSTAPVPPLVVPAWLVDPLTPRVPPVVLPALLLPALLLPPLPLPALPPLALPALLLPALLVPPAELPAPDESAVSLVPPHEMAESTTTHEAKKWRIQ